MSKGNTKCDAGQTEAGVQTESKTWTLATTVVAIGLLMIPVWEGADVEAGAVVVSGLVSGLVSGVASVFFLWLAPMVVSWLRSMEVSRRVSTAILWFGQAVKQAVYFFLKWVWQGFESVSDKVSEFGLAPGLVSGLVSWVISWLGLVPGVEVVSGVVSRVLPGVVFLLGLLPDVSNLLPGFVSGLVTGLVSGLMPGGVSGGVSVLMLGAYAGGVSGLVSGGMSGLLSGLKSGLGALAGGMSGLLSGLMSGLGALAGGVTGSVTGLMSGLMSVVWAGLNAVTVGVSLMMLWLMMILWCVSLLSGLLLVILLGAAMTVAVKMGILIPPHTTDNVALKITGLMTHFEGMNVSGRVLFLVLCMCMVLLGVAALRASGIWGVALILGGMVVGLWVH
ncbi:uncharacterized protein LOC109615948 [Esox lucius]|uniref:uncharacterized protein LOC109615948 n=1 Tax=Esox lucius TaxID=8010 RepID=UPI001476FAE8|nr:uncharacterized protein LOC109615948 [Esox lucius]